MKNQNYLKSMAIAVVFALVLGGCGSDAAQTSVTNDAVRPSPETTIDSLTSEDVSSTMVDSSEMILAEEWDSTEEKNSNKQALFAENSNLDQLSPTASIPDAASIEKTSSNPGFDSAPLVEKQDTFTDSVEVSSLPEVIQAPAPIKESTPRIPYQKMLTAAKTSQSGTSRDCYNTAVRTAQNMGAKGNGYTWKSLNIYRGMSMEEGLVTAIENEDLKPGMIIYVNNTPGADPNSTYMPYQPHWFTYLGKDGSGTPRFSDQYAHDYDLSGSRGIVSTYKYDRYGKQRMMDEILDPWA